jgi:solute carrier family 13 (sodium-dependent dicarboxylate transporter), member 2/3/5
VLALTASLWLTDRVHHLSPAVPALAGAALLMLPCVGVISWKAFESRLSWGLILTVGTSRSLAALMTTTGAAAWLGQLLVSRLSTLAHMPVMLLVRSCSWSGWWWMVVAVEVVHLAFTNLAACVALLLPINATIAASAGLNPAVAGLATLMV